MRRLHCMWMLLALVACGPLAVEPDRMGVIDQAIAPLCAQSVIEAIRAPATSAGQSVVVRCKLLLSLSSFEVVDKRVLFEGAAASGSLLECNGASIDVGRNFAFDYGQDAIEVRSRKRVDSAGNVSWERPEDVRIRNCRITGSVRIWGMGRNGEATDVRDSSRQRGHVARVRSNAPTRITLDGLTLTAKANTHLYVGPGVTQTHLLRSTFFGSAASVALYLDTESASNLIEDNQFHAVSSANREVLAVDGSSSNVIKNNYFSGLNKGGIYLYRNCGQGGTIRITPPQYNQILNNVFYYNVYDGANPSVYLGSRDDNPRDYCDADDGYPYGSSANDRDHARYNQVLQNQIYKRSVSDMIRVGGTLAIETFNTHNVIAYNETVTAAVDRFAGCYISSGYLKTFLLHGERIDLYRDSTGRPICTGYQDSCQNGVLTRSPSTSCSLSSVGFGCSVTGVNAGCEKAVSCPPGRAIVGAVAACNLEFGAVETADLAAVPGNQIRVLRASDVTRQGACWVGASQLSTGVKSLAGLRGLNAATYGCREHDDNGGDCHVRGVAYCR